eukprot:gene25109-biopygen21659
MAGAVAVIIALFPQGDAGEHVDVHAARALGEARGGDGDDALEHQRELALHVIRRFADGEGAGDIGRAVAVLAAAVDQIELAILQLAV